MDALEQIERSTVVPPLTPGNSPPDDVRSPSALGQVIPHPLKETRAALEKLISRIEGLSVEFDRLMERSGKFVAAYSTHLDDTDRLLAFSVVRRPYGAF